jgi:hypothetical protein
VSATNSSEEIVDHSLHGLVSVRMESAPPSVKDKVRRRLGPSSDSSEGEPDIRLSFKESLPTSGRLRFLGLNHAAYDDYNFYLLDDSGNRMKIDLAALGEPCELVCERAFASLSFLLPMIGLRLLRKGHVLLHSSSFVHDGNGCLVAGWQKGGKTEMLLAFMSKGAAFVSNEWSILSPKEGLVHGVGGILQVWDWHLRYLPQYMNRLPASDRRRLKLLRIYKDVYSAFPKGVAPRGAAWKALHQLSLEGGVSSLRQVRTPPERLFGDSLWNGPASLDRVFLATVGTGDTRVFSTDPDEIANRMVASQRYERRELLALYDHFRFAFPEQGNELLEHAHEHELRLLLQALSDRPAYEIAHPYPVPLEDLYTAAVPFCA